MNSAQVCTIAGITYRQLNHWVYAGYIPGAQRLINGSGYPREITPAECAYVARLARLVRAGIDVRTATEALADGVVDGVLPDSIDLGNGVEIVLHPVGDRQAVSA